MTRRCFVVGHPIAHSRSPLIHCTWLAQHGLDGSYERIDVAPADLPAFVARLRRGEFTGGNVTVPHKEAAISLIDDVGAAARAIGAVNTLWREGDRLCGDNTDAAGFLGHLDATAPDWEARTQTALIVGAGGAARAVVHALKGRGLRRIVVVNRNPARAAALVAAFGSPLVAMDWSARSACIGDADLIVNTTSLGMKGQPPLDLDLAALQQGAIVDDLVYVPLQTALLVEAERRGATIVDGLGMLLHQAVPGFDRWFGVVPLVTPALRTRLEADILGA